MCIRDRPSFAVWGRPRHTRRFIQYPRAVKPLPPERLGILFALCSWHAGLTGMNPPCEPIMPSPSVEQKAFILLLVLVTIAFFWILLPFYGAVFWAMVLALSLIHI